MSHIVTVTSICQRALSAEQLPTDDDDDDAMTDPEDILSESLQTLYEYVPTTRSSAGSIFRYLIPDRLANQGNTIPIEPSHRSSRITLETPDTQPANWSLHASSIWVSSLFVADHLDDLHLPHYIEASSRRGERLRVLELGAGAGLPGICIAKIYEGVSIISSDYPDADLIDTLASNIQRNGVTDRCRAVAYAWGSDASILSEAGCDSHSEQPRKFDVVLAADTLWNPELHGPFIETLRLTLRDTADARIYLVAGLHTGRYTIQAFLKSVSEAGFDIEEATERQVTDGDSCRPWTIERAEGEDEMERRRWVIWMVLRWKRL
ncbi:Protein N-methyltransferase nnt1 [Grifola frondosa]|uniref:Protein N-methyltransferase nnt1 n=1 Tax=Grifola frondosa TaxID=5627 RepID=A0A1C7M9C4_GRIFR|nr:Protein N-methyltransferase nnt1 [Grifola frondosa]